MKHKMFSLTEGLVTGGIAKPLVMGVLNVTPDSFSDGGKYSGVHSAYDRGMQMLEQGASIIDVGGESSRPGAQPVTASEELQRVIPVVEKLCAQTDCLVSVDTAKPEVMRAAAVAGAGLLNDINALRAAGAVEVAAETGLYVCLMHMRGTPKTMQEAPKYKNVVAEVMRFFQQRIDICVSSGIVRDKILLDPGFGFGKTLEHNLQLFANLPSFHRFDLPILVGVSRKSMFEHLLGREVGDRLAGSLAMAALAVEKGVSIVRTHDVRETCDAIDTAFAVSQSRLPSH